MDDGQAIFFEWDAIVGRHASQDIRGIEFFEVAIPSKFTFDFGDFCLEMLYDASWNIRILVLGTEAGTICFCGNTLTARNGAIAFDFAAATSRAREDRATTFSHDFGYD
jgi:hypothetical protein